MSIQIQKTSKLNHSVWLQFEGSGRSLFQIHAQSPILVIGIRICKIGFLSVDGIRIQVRAGRCTVFKEHGQHTAQGMLTADIIFFVSGQAGIAFEGPAVFGAPVVWESVTEDSAFSEPVAVPVADCRFMQMIIRLLAVEEFENGDLLLGSAFSRSFKRFCCSARAISTPIPVRSLPALKSFSGVQTRIFSSLSYGR